MSGWTERVGTLLLTEKEHLRLLAGEGFALPSGRRIVVAWGLRILPYFAVFFRANLLICFVFSRR